jgi:hypothetical protein
MPSIRPTDRDADIGVRVGEALAQVGTFANRWEAWQIAIDPTLRGHFSEQRVAEIVQTEKGNVETLEEHPPNDFESFARQHTFFPFCYRRRSGASGGLGGEHLRAEQRLPEGLLVSGHGGRDALPRHRVRCRRDLHPAEVRSRDDLLVRAPAVHRR